MDIEVARTFLEITRSGSFIAAASRLHVTQTTVTARIASLEDQLGCRLFIRNRSGARLTADGERFSAYAVQLVQTWEKAKLDLPLPSGHSSMITIGGETALWNPLLFKWVEALRHGFPDLVVRTETAMAEQLIGNLSQGTLDAAILHRVEYIPGFQVELLLEEKLILVSAGDSDLPYIYVDWGPEFRKQHDAVLPEFARPVRSFDFGPLALQYLLEFGGSGFFRTRAVANQLASGQVKRVAHAPEFTYPVYLVYSKQHKNIVLEKVLRSLYDVVHDDPAW